MKLFLRTSSACFVEILLLSFRKILLGVIDLSDRLLLVLLIIIGLILVPDSNWVFAQNDDINWSTPLNLSRSGSASDPDIVVDSNDRIHIVWSDLYSGVFYLEGDGEEWTELQNVNLPFGLTVPYLLADFQGIIHAFWVEKEEQVQGTPSVVGDEGVLYYSRVSAVDFANAAAWSIVQRLSDSALVFSVAIDSEGQLHLAYIRPSLFPGTQPGLYYQNLGGESLSWSTPTLLYQSPYFRSLAAEVANVSIDTGFNEETVQVFVSWDNPAEERIYFQQSQDGGETWLETEEVDRPGEGTEAGRPSNLIVFAKDKAVLRYWQSALSESNCVQYYQWSFDGGQNWENRQTLLNDLRTCATDVKIHELDGNLILLFLSDFPYLQAWDGSRWSDPQYQNTLTSFTNPETFGTVNLGCLDSALDLRGNLYVVGCALDGPQDIWLLRRSLVDQEDWYPREPVWDSVQTIANTPERFSSLAILAEQNSRVHALWSIDRGIASALQPQSLMYSRWESGQWSLPEAVITSSQGRADQPDLAIDPGGQLLAVWSGGLSGEIMFSKADAARASIPASWSEPIRLPAPLQAGSSPQILVQGNGGYLVIYAIPLNEGRGVYLTRSEDGGRTWSEALQVFDGVSAGWAMVDNPHLAMTNNGHLQAIWTQYSLPPGSSPMALYYASSADRGQTWSAPSLVTDKPVTWSAIFGVGEQTVERVWQEFSANGTTLWHEQSLDGGGTWTRVAPFSIFGEIAGRPGVAVDDGGQLHLLQVVSRDQQEFELQHWFWNGFSWAMDQQADLFEMALTSIEDLVVDVSETGNLAVLFTGMTNESAAGTDQEDLFFTRREISTSDNSVVIQATTLPTEPPVSTTTTPVTITPAPTAGPTEEPRETPEEILPTSTAFIDLSATPPPTQNASLAATVGPIAAMLLVFIMIVVVVVFVRRRKNISF